MKMTVIINAANGVSSRNGVMKAISERNENDMK